MAALQQIMNLNPGIFLSNLGGPSQRLVDGEKQVRGCDNPEVTKTGQPIRQSNGTSRHGVIRPVLKASLRVELSVLSISRMNHSR